MVETGTLLGCAFASGDCLFETDEQGVIGFASGATSLLGRDADQRLTGKAWSAVLTSHVAALARAIGELAPGERAGPLRVASGTAGRPDLLIALYRNPQHPGRVCWSVAAEKAVAVLPEDKRVPSAERVAFDAEVERRFKEAAGGAAALLDLRRSDIAAEQEAALHRALDENELKGVQGTRLANRRYALIVDDVEAATLQGRLASVLGVDDASLDEALAFQPLSGPKPELLRHALKVAVDRFTSSEELSPIRLIDLLEAQTRETEKRAAALQTRVRLRNFTLVYQPIVELGSAAVHHCEALIRFREGESPFEVIKFAENTGFIGELDWATVNEALSVLRSNYQYVPVAVNLSAQSLVSERFVSEVVAVYRKTPTAAGRLHLEITESSALTELEAANKQIQRLRTAGMSVALDDFGAGAASLAYLQQLEVDTVKIDRDYVRNLAKDARSRPIVGNIAQLCRQLGATTVGEGVETADVAETLRTLGVDYGQGWCFGRPAPAPMTVARTAQPARRARA